MSTLVDVSVALTVSGTLVTADFAISGGANLTVPNVGVLTSNASAVTVGDVTMTGGTSGTITLTTGAWSVSGNWDTSGAGSTFTQGTSVVTMTGAGKTLTTQAGQPFDTLVVTGAVALSVNLNVTTLTVNTGATLTKTGFTITFNSLTLLGTTGKIVDGAVNVTRFTVTNSEPAALTTISVFTTWTLSGSPVQRWTHSSSSPTTTITFTISGLTGATDFAVNKDGAPFTTGTVTGGVASFTMLGSDPSIEITETVPGGGPSDFSGIANLLAFFVGFLFIVLLVASGARRVWSDITGKAPKDADRGGGVTGIPFGAGRKEDRKAAAKLPPSRLEKMTGLDKIDFSGLQQRPGRPPSKAKAGQAGRSLFGLGRSKSEPSTPPSSERFNANMERMTGMDKVDFSSLKMPAKKPGGSKPEPGKASQKASEQLDKALGLDTIKIPPLKPKQTDKPTEPLSAKASRRMDKLMGLDKIQLPKKRGLFGKPPPTKPPRPEPSPEARQLEKPRPYTGAKPRMLTQEKPRPYLKRRTRKEKKESQ